MIDFKDYGYSINKIFNNKKSYLNKEVIHLRNTTHCVVDSKRNTQVKLPLTKSLRKTNTN